MERKAEATLQDLFRQPIFIAQLLPVVTKTLYPQLPTSDWLASKLESVIILFKGLGGGCGSND